MSRTWSPAFLADLRRFTRCADPHDSLAAVLNVAREEIRDDVRAGIVPYDVGGFGELHDFVDANGYGGAFEWPDDATWQDNTPGDYTESHWRFWCDVQDSLHLWIEAGSLLTTSEE